MIHIKGKRRTQPAWTYMQCQGNKEGKDFSATPKPCSHNKQPYSGWTFPTSRKH